MTFLIRGHAKTTNLILTMILVMIPKKTLNRTSRENYISLLLFTCALCRAIPTANRKKDKPEVPADVRIKELQQEIGISRDQFARKDRARDRQLRELQVTNKDKITLMIYLFTVQREVDGKIDAPTLYGDEIVGKKLQYAEN